jgi:four helix bundle protein
MRDHEQHPTFENGADIRDRTFRFGCRVARFCERLYEQGVNARTLSGQLLRAGSAPAAMLEEARSAESRADFLSKVTIGLKESREAHVRLRACVECGYGPAEEAASLTREANEIVAILVSITASTKRNSPAADRRHIKRRRT